MTKNIKCTSSLEFLYATLVLVALLCSANNENSTKIHHFHEFDPWEYFVINKNPIFWQKIYNVHQVINFCIPQLYWWCSYVAQMMKTAPISIIFMNFTPMSVVLLKKPQKKSNFHWVIYFSILLLYWWRSYIVQLYVVEQPHRVCLSTYIHTETLGNKIFR